VTCGIVTSLIIGDPIQLKKDSDQSHNTQWWKNLITVQHRHRRETKRRTTSNLTTVSVGIIVIG